MMNRRFFLMVTVLVTCCHCSFGEDRWVWSNRNRRDRTFEVDRSDRATANDKYRSELYVRNERQRQREREPTTKRPTPGIPQNDDIDDYVDTDNKNVGTRNYPYVPNGFYGGQLAGGGFNTYPGVGFGGNGILVGPGGPTGIIGRPQQYYPGGASAGSFPSALGQPNFGAPVGGNPGFPIQPGSGIGGVSGYPNGFGQVQGYPGAQGGQYPGGQFPGAQYPGGQIGGGAQYPGIGQYPAGGQFPSGQFNPGQYPGGGPIYTEGYGLANLNGYPPNGVGFPQNPFGGFNGFGTGFDELGQSQKNLQPGGKSALAESRNLPDRTVDDKVNKNLKKPT